MLYQRLVNQVVQCNVCFHQCKIAPSKRGFCGVRENHEGTLMALNYGKTIAVSIDKVEKKPLYHFLPNTDTYSYATLGCNMRCPWCQNESIAYVNCDQVIEGYSITPQEHVRRAKMQGLKSISYTYTEPTIFIEYALDTMKLATAQGLKNIWVSNGLMSDQALEEIIPYLDAINVDFKGPNNKVYKTFCSGDYECVVKNLKRLNTSKVHLEVTSLIVPGVNDSEEALRSMVKTFKEVLGTDVPWHISRFFPAGKMFDKLPTEIDILKRLKKYALHAGIKHVYLGNV